VKLIGSRSEIEMLMAILKKTPMQMARHTEGLNQERLGRAPAAGEWSVIEVLAHLQACQEVWSYTIYAMLAFDQPTLALIHPRKWARIAGYERLSFHKCLQAFTLRREALLEALNRLDPTGWERQARIGNRVHSIFSQARRMALHEAGHCEQIENILAAVD
jgi:hypothetical protein